MKRLIVIFSLTTCISWMQHIRCQVIPEILSARAFALGDAGAALQDVHATYTNPSGVAAIQGWGVQVNASQRFGLEELSQLNLAVALPYTGSSAFFGTVQRFGYSAFRQQKVALGYARRLTAGFSAAVQFELHHFQIAGYGNASTPGYGVSLQHEVADVLILGTSISNPVPIETAEGIDIPVQIILGAAYMPSELVTVVAEVEKEGDFDPRFKFGAEYRIVHSLALRLGGSTGPGRIHAGVGYRIRKGLAVDLAAAYHAQLGIMPAVGVSLTKDSDGDPDRLFDH